MKRSIRCIEGPTPLVIVTTVRSMWNPGIWFGSLTPVSCKAYRKMPDGSFEDFDGNAPPEDVLQDILDNTGE